MKESMKRLINDAKAMALTAFPLLAQGDEKKINLQPEGDSLASRLSGLTIGGIITALLKLALVIAAIVFFFILVIGGIRWIVSGGDKTGAETARKRITAALVGLAIVFVAWAIGSLINVLFGIDIFNMNIPTLYKK